MDSLVGNSILFKCCNKFYPSLEMKIHLAQSHSTFCPYCMAIFHSNTTGKFLKHCKEPSIDGMLCSFDQQAHAFAWSKTIKNI